MDQARWIRVNHENSPRSSSTAQSVLEWPGLRAFKPVVAGLAGIMVPPSDILWRKDPPGAISPSGDALTVMTANLLHDWPRLKDQEARLEALARMVEREQVDIALFQEVGRDSSFRVAEWLAERLPMAFVYARVNGELNALGVEEGLAIFSRYPLARPSVKPLTRAVGLFRRYALGAVVVTPWGEVTAYNAHFSLRPWRNRRQPAILYEWVGRTAGERPAFIGGDFNATETQPGIAGLQAAWVDAFRAVHPDADAPTHDFPTSLGPVRRRRLDYLFLRPGARPWRAVEARHLMAPEIRHSDHLAVVVRFETAP